MPSPAKAAADAAAEETKVFVKPESHRKKGDITAQGSSSSMATSGSAVITLKTGSAIASRLQATERASSSREKISLKSVKNGEIDRLGTDI